LFNKKYFYTEFHENPTDTLDTGSRTQTDGLGLHLRRSHYFVKLFTYPLGRAVLWHKEFRKCISVQFLTMRVAPVVATFGSYTA